MENNLSYSEQKKIECTKKIREMRKTLPIICNEYFLGIENTTSPLTKVGYAQDLQIFFNFLHTEIIEFMDKDIRNFDYNDLESVTVTHVEMYLNYLNYYQSINGRFYRNNEQAKCRKLASLGAFFRYFFKKDKISKNIIDKIDPPKIHEKAIIRLDKKEVERILDVVENGENLTKTQKHYHCLNCVRDTAIITLFLGTGIRISELVGINMSDIDFNNNSFTITRKGGNQYILYMPDEVIDALQKYFEVRIHQKPDKEIDKDALFLSLKNKRITIRAVQNLVHKYSKIASPLKKISPHKLRSTYGTNLYQATHDIYIVAEVLGHKDVNTTKKHYAAISEDIRKEAATHVKLRSKKK